MKALIIGYGSIGSRHADILRDMGLEVSIVSSRKETFLGCYPNTREALDATSPDYVVIANKTHEHHSSLQELATLGFRGTVLIEKPLFHEVNAAPVNEFSAVHVGYNLRFHPLILRLKEILAGQQLVSAQIYAGQYLPLWRPERDYRQTYSSRRENGGGVLRDLSHELDYVNWLFGGWKSLTALGGRYSSIEIESDDAFSILMATERCPMVQIHLNYLDRASRRELLINLDQATVKIDLVKGTGQINSDEFQYDVPRNSTFRKLHQAVLDRDEDKLCSLEEGMEIIKMIDAIELSAQKQTWIIK
ncbi:MAG: Gfo/Idh/MocA family oxidoreductase [Candidatus Nitrohelix vancouverensis]|uniref:Gfo/Idh/MocA family oxidoreductase n=1 Tax=Candidatus Nitrohelix vancouverensis TaxID=2705534 RepID=A0A7T0C034_9BACT|nr:MAG: Gfo/Idh/MocA family oxidoreductase [Candidatus Nitrohelix vancouverensis]